MTLNNWLCRNFDMEKKGYVTIGDVFGKIAKVLEKSIKYFLAFILVFVFGGLFGNIYSGNEPTIEKYPEPSLYNMGRWILEGWIPIIYFFDIIILVAGVCYLLYKVRQIKIAKYELKDKE